jgi:hypothetical protein
MFIQWQLRTEIVSNLTVCNNNSAKIALPDGAISNPIITNNDIWEGYRYAYSNLTIPNGTTLTIKGKVGFAEGVKLIIERGGHLIIDGGLLTNSCTEMWNGIEVQGNSNQIQLVAEQGWIEIINDGTIKNSVNGIYTNKPDPESEGSYVVGYTGGIIEADEAHFINNGTAVYFHSYPYQSVSYIKDCTFETNEDYPGNEYPEQFVKAVSMNGVDIINCDFINNVANGNDQKGLYSINSHIVVKGKCTSGSPCTTWDYGLFENLQYGIYATATSSSKYIEIEHSDFNNNMRSVYISGMSNAVVIDNNFEINSPYSEYNGGYGLYLDHSTGYTIEDNNFFHEGAIETGLGLVVNESGKNTNMIYRNFFTNLECGMDIQGKNRNKDGIGLQLKCNQYDGTLMDKVITWNEPFANSQAGIAIHQGSSNGSPEDMAGNLFEVPSQTPNNDYDDILNQGNQITYYYPDDYDDIRVIPVDYTENTVSLEEVDVFNWSYENGCPPLETSGGGIEEGRVMMNTAQAEIDSLHNILTVLIDGGNTDVLQSDVDNSVPPQAMDVYNELMNKSPYLSDTVISTAIEKEDVLPGAMIRDIMVANPKAAKSDELMGKLDKRWNPLPDYMKAQILQGRSIVSIREETESRLAASIQDEAKGFSSLIRGFNNDTIDPGASRDSLILLFENDNRLGSKYSLAFMRLEQGEGSLGQSVLNDIHQQFELTDIETVEHQQLLLFYDILLSLHSAGKNVVEVDSLQLSELLAIEAAGQGQASVYARNILLALNAIDYEEPIILPDMLKSSEAVVEYQELLNKAVEAPGYIKIQPNPAKDYIILKYDLEMESDAVIEMNNLSGKLMHTERLRNKTDEIVIDTRSWNTGVYIATLKIEGKMIESVKFTIVD